jgi:transcriptional regulator with XRE-family HTH domain
MTNGVAVIKSNASVGTLTQRPNIGIFIKEEPMTFGTTIRDLRKTKRLTLRELAKKVGIDFTYLSKIENDYGPPPAESTIRRLAVELDADADELVLLADKLPGEFEQDLLDRPEEQVAELYRSLRGRRYTDEEWTSIMKQLKERGENL